MSASFSAPAAWTTPWMAPKRARTRSTTPCIASRSVTSALSSEDLAAEGLDGHDLPDLRARRVRPRRASAQPGVPARRARAAARGRPGQSFARAARARCSATASPMPPSPPVISTTAPRAQPARARPAPRLGVEREQLHRCTHRSAPRYATVAPSGARDELARERGRAATPPATRRLRRGTSTTRLAMCGHSRGITRQGPSSVAFSGRRLRLARHLLQSRSTRRCTRAPPPRARAPARGTAG